MDAKSVFSNRLRSSEGKLLSAGDDTIRAKDEEGCAGRGMGLSLPFYSSTVPGIVLEISWYEIS